MRDNFNISALSNNMFCDLNALIPVPDLPVVTNATNISTNVYYGYQPVTNEPEKKDVNNCEMEVQYTCSENNCVKNIQDVTRVLNRKRQSNEMQEVDFKKRRQNDNTSFPDSSTQPKFGRKPTHNLPDIPRNIFENRMTIIIEKKANIEIWESSLEELLFHTHGFSSYHWKQETDL
ncbi:hypothetical protein HHI36_010264 [Cryptolaemus montrouzieri]|uniref:Uncharacterized protein n=1 Tax=Cryptolaemus montrouzieri TaxID=559131 RepID=A0ABD2MI93_9CUCU